jgi:hypothetical protein
LEASLGGLSWMPLLEASLGGLSWRPVLEASLGGLSWRPLLDWTLIGWGKIDVARPPVLFGAGQWRRTCTHQVYGR